MAYTSVALMLRPNVCSILYSESSKKKKKKRHKDADKERAGTPILSTSLTDTQV